MATSLPAYAELHCLSNFTFLRGASHAEELIERAARLGYAALAITDECSVAGVVRAHVAAKEQNFKLIIGSEVRVNEGPKLVVLAMDREGYGNLSQLITTARRRTTKGIYRVEWQDFETTAGCLALLVPDAIPNLLHAQRTEEHFAGRTWVAVELLGGPDDRARLEALSDLANAAGLPAVASGDVHMHVRSRRPLQNVLTATRVGKPVAEAGHALYPNAERHLRMRMRLAQIYPAELLAESLVIAERCQFSLDCLKYEYPEEVVPAGMTAAAYLRELTETGLQKRFPEGTEQHVRKQVEYNSH